MRHLSRGLESWLLAVAFAVAYTQSPLYWSNQNQYFLHGLAAGGAGDLASDWLACTTDPTPVFSGLVAFGFRHLGPWVFQLGYVAILAFYFRQIERLLDNCLGIDRPGRLLSLALIIVAHSAGVRYASVLLTGKDYPWFIQAGLAGQYLLGPGLQPSVFGVMLLSGFVAFSEGRPLEAAAWTSLSTVFHSTYLLPAALFILAYQITLSLRGKYKSAFQTGLMALALVIPAVAYVSWGFLGADAAVTEEAQRLLVDVRIPHHCHIENAIDKVALVQIGAIVIGLLVLRKSPVGQPLTLVSAAALTLSVVQLVTDSRPLALLFPWRVSAVLVPVAAAALTARIACDAVSRCQGLGKIAWAYGLTIAASATGTIMTARGVGFPINRAESNLIEFVRQNRRPGDVYLIPVTIPKLSAGPRGSVSMTFAVPPPLAPGLIPLDFQRFRLATGAAIYVDFKSIPYRATEVIEWHRRLELVANWYSTGSWAVKTPDLIQAGITHVVIPANHASTGPGQSIYTDEHYTLYQIERN
ncbi:MAG: hypothetical protein K1X57_09940 [Gemmataceae bacterium]|nr:hypothetical protein [Gemmataceae bacterium]